MKKNIFYWSPYLGRIATIKAVINSASILKKIKKDYLVSIIDCYQEWDKYREILNQNCVDIISLQKNIKFNINTTGFFKSRLIYILSFFLLYRKLKRLLNSEKPDFLMVHLLTYIPIICFFFNNFHTKLFLRISGRPQLTIFRYYLWKLIDKKLDIVFCPTIETLEYLKSKKIFSANKLFYLPDPIIDIKKINVLKKQKLNEKYLLKKDFFISVGRLTEQKNHIFLINCFKKYADKFDLIILGEGELKTDLINAIRMNNLNDSVKVYNYENNIYPLLIKSKALIVSSKWEDPGFVMIESAAANTTIICSNCASGPKEFINKGQCGYIFESEDKISFHNVMNDFLTDKQSSIFNKKCFAKKKSKDYTKLNHFKILNQHIN
jgi:glycosyltransferase involved in cell wall biosynthesis